jgi:radical SAM protein with 4Fe4S-binding SPASM domain
MPKTATKKSKKSVKERIRGMMYHGPAEMLLDSVARKPRELAVSKAYHSKQTDLKYYPIHLDIESTSICNLDCPMCPYPEMRIKKGNMSFDLFQNIVDQCDGKVFDVLLHMYGEPLVNKEIFKMISYAKSKGVRVTSMSTNLTLLTKEKGKQLIEAGLDKITLSFDGTDKETFEKVRLGANYEKCLENLIGFLQLKEQMKAKNPFTVLQIIQMKETEPGLKEFVERFSKMSVDLLKVKSFDTWAGQIEHKTEEMKPSTYHRNNVNDNRKPCPLLWYYMSIRWDGRVVPCCRDYDNHEILGDITKESLMQIWNGKRFQLMRSEHLEGNYENSVLCAKCVEWSKYKMPEPEKLLQRISPVMRII